VTADVGEQVTDADLVAGYRRNSELFTAVHDRYFRDIYLYVAGRLDTQVAEDIAAETFLLTLDRRDRFDLDKGGLRPWLFGFATNLVARHRRKEARHYKALARLDPASVVEGHENRVGSPRRRESRTRARSKAASNCASLILKAVKRASSWSSIPRRPR
jgi:DNA-directed RNA polymerase specialized sigma24 family protein